MTAPDRIACLNPRCRRTASRAKMGADCDEIICGKCWRALPADMRERHRRIQLRYKRLMRLVDRRVNAGTIAPHVVNRIGDPLHGQIEASWARIRNYYVTPERPAGLDMFLEAIGL